MFTVVYGLERTGFRLLTTYRRHGHFQYGYHSTHPSAMYRRATKVNCYSSRFELAEAGASKARIQALPSFIR